MILKRDPITDVVTFIKNWVGDVRKTHRIPKSQIARKIPAPLKELYHHFGNYPPRKGRKLQAKYGVPLFSTQDYLFPLSRIKTDRDRFTFLAENQGVFYCTTECDAEDPPVQVHWSGSPDYNDATGEPFDVCCKRLSQFLATFCLQEIALGSRHVCAVSGNNLDASDICVKRYKRLWMNGPYVDCQSKYSFYLCSDRLILFRWGAEFLLCANDHQYADLIAPSLKLIEITGKLPT